MIFKVLKRNGTIEDFKVSKIEKVINFTNQDLNVDLEKFKKQFSLTFKDQISTKEIQQNLIKAALECSFDPDTDIVDKKFDIMANRLYLFNFWKEFRLKREEESGKLLDETGMFKSANDWIEHLEKYVDLGVYNEIILKINKDILKKLYTSAKKVNQDFEDYSYPHFMWNNSYYQTYKFAKSYLIKYNNNPIETFEEALLLISVLGFYEDYKKDKDLFIENVKKFYYHLVNYHFIPATPQLLNLRRKNGNLSSCNILNVYDNLNSIMYSLWQSANITKNAGGVGIAFQLRASNSYLMNNFGNANHIQMWSRLFNDIAVAVNQGGVRAGAITLALPIWHKDIIEFAESKSPLGEARLKTFDIFPQVLVPNLFIDYLIQEKDWYIFDPYELKKFYNIDLFEIYGDEFKKQYERAIELADEGKLNNFDKINSVKLATIILKSITSSGLPYLVFEDNINTYSNFNGKIYCANLCVESFSPFRNTNPENIILGEKVSETDGYIHSCNLFSLNLPILYESGILFDDEKLKDTIKLAVRYMDNILEVTKQPLKEIENHNRYFRTIGIGYLGFADLMVKLTVDENRLYTYKFTQKSAGNSELYNEYKNNMMSLIKKVFGRVALYSIYASVELSKERGVPLKYNETKWKDGILLGRYDTNKLTIDELSEIFNVDKKDIEYVIDNLKKYGIRNTMLLNCPPNTSTSIYAGTSASIFPVYNIIQQETQRSGNYIVYPRYIDYRLYYDTYKSWTIDDVNDIIEFVAKVQEYIDSGISFEYPINLNNIKREDIPKYLTRFLITAPKKGIKALYYGRTISTQGKECESCAN